jgi:hypothetical protein
MTKIDCEKNTEEALDKLSKGDDKKKKSRQAFVRDTKAQLEFLQKITRDVDAGTKKKMFDEFYDKKKFVLMQELKAEIMSKQVEANFKQKLNFKELNSPFLVMNEHLKETQLVYDTYKTELGNMLTAGLDKEGILEWVGNLDNQKQVIVELAHMDAPGAKVNPTGSIDAMKAAKVIKKVLNKEYQYKTNLGIPVSKVPNYGGPQIWSPEKLANFDEAEFVNDMLKSLDTTNYYKGLGTKELSEILEEAYKDISTSLDTRSLDFPDMIKAEKSPQGIVQRLLNSRTIHLKPEATLQMYEKYGSENLLENLLRHINSTSRRLALVQQFGVSPQAGFNALTKVLNNSLDETQRQSLKNDIPRLKQIFTKLYNPFEQGFGESKVAKTGKALRSAVSVATLGKAVFSSATDAGFGPGYATSLFGNSFLENVKNYATTFIKAVPEANRKELALLMGNIYENTLQDGYERFGDVAPSPFKNGFSKMNQTLHRMTLLPWQMDRSLIAQKYLGSWYIAKHADLKYEALPVNLQAVFERSRITPEQWEVIRGGVTDYKGTTIVSSAKILESGDTKLINDSARNLQLVLGKVAQGIPRAGIRETSLLEQGSVDSIMGQAIRSVAMYKSFPIASWNLVSDIARYNPADIQRNILGVNIKNQYVNLSKTILSTMSLAYMAIIMKEYLGNNREAPGFKNKDGSVNKELIGRLLVEGGGLGLYADLVFSEYSKREGKTLASKLSGPVISKLDDSIQLVWGGVRGEKDTGDAVNFLLKNIPVYNSPIVKTLFDVAFVNTLRDTVDPGWQSRARKYLKGDTDLFGGSRDYLVDPRTNLLDIVD